MEGTQPDSNNKFLTPTRIVATLVVFGVVYVGWRMLPGHTEEKPPANVTLPAGASTDAATLPDFSIPTIDGRTIKVSDYRGKVLVMDFWATWCPPCQQETPHLVQIANENKSRGVEVVGLHIDDRGRSSPAAIRSFMSQYGISYTVGMATNQMFEAYLGTEDDSIPQTLVFGRNGRLIRHVVGFGPSQSRSLAEAVTAALAGS